MILVYTRSEAFRAHLERSVDQPMQFLPGLVASVALKEPSVTLIHGSDYPAEELIEFIRENRKSLGRIAVADDEPAINRMMAISQVQLEGYCNTYMAPAHYLQMFKLLAEGMSWFPPHLLSDVFSLVREQYSARDDERLLALLSPREREVAEHIAAGRANKEVAAACGITERTVKAHLTHIYSKLDLKDRVGLVLLLQGVSSQSASRQ